MPTSSLRTSQKFFKNFLGGETNNFQIILSNNCRINMAAIIFRCGDGQSRIWIRRDGLLDLFNTFSPVFPVALNYIFMLKFLEIFF